MLKPRSPMEYHSASDKSTSDSDDDNKQGQLKTIRGRRRGRKPRPSITPGAGPKETVTDMAGQPSPTTAPPSGGFYHFLTASDYDRGNNQDVRPSDVWSGLKEQTTAHGIPHVTHAKGPIKKAFWSIMTLITVGALLYNLIAITISFFSYNVDVSIKLYHENELTFPAVTICNMSPVRASALGSSGVEALKRRRKKRSVSNDCSGDWTLYQSACYWSSNITRSQADAVSHCSSFGAQLVDIKDSVEYSFVKTISTDLFNESYWLSLKLSASSNEWLWSDGANAVYTNWESLHPDGSGNCVVLTSEGYQDISCTSLSKFICWKNIVQETTTEAWTIAGHEAEATASLSDASCCCTCCFTADDSTDPTSTDTCGVCTGRDASNAAHCAAAATPTAPTTPKTTTTTTAEPQPIPGSQFPERVQTREEFQQEEKLTESLAEITDESEKQAIGYSAADLILDCQYSGYTCSIEEMDTFYNPVLGNCYIFNSGWTNKSLPLKSSLKAGRRYGLHLIINIDQNEYVKEVGDTAGIRLVIHPQTRMPFPEDEGITVSPGHATSIGMKQVQLQRKGKPYGPCTDPTIDHKDHNVYEELYPVQYSANACERTCYQREVIKECGCGDSSSPMVGKALNIGDKVIKPCSSSNITQDDCRYKMSQRYKNNTLTCDCPDSCTDTAYSLEVSIGEWPSKVQKDSLLQKLAPKIGTSFDITDPDEYKANLIKAEIYYEEFNFEYISERPSYPPSNYLSDIGGVLGLWVGFSILTIFEFVEFFMDIIVILVARCRMKQAAKKKQQKSPVQSINIIPPSDEPPKPDGVNMKSENNNPNPKPNENARGVSRVGHTSPEEPPGVLPEPGGMGNSAHRETPPPPYASRQRTNTTDTPPGSIDTPRQVALRF